MDALALCIENFFSYAQMVGGSPAGGLFQAPGGSAAGASGFDSADDNYAVFAPAAAAADLPLVAGFFEQRGLPFMVPVFPDLNENFRRRLNECGIISHCEYTAMSLPLADVPKTADDNAVRAISDADVRAWAQAAWLGFGDLGPASPEFLCFSRYLAACRSNRLYCLRQDGRAVCTGILHQSKNTCGLYYFAVPPAFRRRGYAKRLLKTLAAAAGTSELVLLATAAGLPVYLDSGFKALAAVPVSTKGRQ